jgi:hypothetical protein
VRRKHVRGDGTTVMGENGSPRTPYGNEAPAGVRDARKTETRFVPEKKQPFATEHSGFHTHAARPQFCLNMKSARVEAGSNDCRGHDAPDKNKRTSAAVCYLNRW